MAKTREQKEQELKELVKLISNSPVIGIANIERLPASQLQKIKKKLRGEINLKVAKNILMTKALDEISNSKPGIESLKSYIQGQNALVTTTLNPFKLAKVSKDTRMAMPAKGGNLAPEDILVKAGETSFKPGPIVGELQKAGIPASIERGKVVIRNDKIVAKKGEVIGEELAHALARLEIFPFTAGLDLRAVYEDGVVYTSEILAIDELKLKEDFRKAATSAFNLALGIYYPTKLTAPLLIRKAYQQALNLGVNASIYEKTTIKHLIQKAYIQGLTLGTRIKETG
ncbi:MAG: 50S ribosomal protein L10 [Candidatus Thermoplasmatota archaeon]